AGKRLAVGVPPLARACRVSRGDHAGAHESISVLLTLREIDRPALSHRGEHRRQAIEHALDALEVPYPAALAVRTRLRELLARSACDLHNDLALGVAVEILNGRCRLAGAA